METPFVFGRIAIGKNFTNRQKEIKRLIQNFTSGINTIIISPRRWGKSSLVLKASDIITKQNKKIKIITLDLFNIRTEEEFYMALTKSVLKISAGKLEEVINYSKKFFKQWTPRISFSPDSQNEYNIGFEWSEIKKQPDEVLNLAENIAISKGINMIICIDEFQNIGYFEDPLAFQKKLRSHWQKHQSVTYCLYGSKRHMLMNVFSSSSMPFYKFGDLMFLSKIGPKHWGKYIVKRYNETEKEIRSEDARYLSLLVECHPYYVQQLAQLSWLRTETKTTVKTIDISLDSLILQLSLLFQNIIENLNLTQLNFLKALVRGESQLSSKETINKYNFGTSANVIQIKKALIKKEIIDNPGKKIEILDPVFSIWLKKYYFI